VGCAEARLRAALAASGMKSGFKANPGIHMRRALSLLVASMLYLSILILLVATLVFVSLMIWQKPTPPANEIANIIFRLIAGIPAGVLLVLFSPIWLLTGVEPSDLLLEVASQMSIVLVLFLLARLYNLIVAACICLTGYTNNNTLSSIFVALFLCPSLLIIWIGISSSRPLLAAQLSIVSWIFLLTIILNDSISKVASLLSNKKVSAFAWIKSWPGWLGNAQEPEWSSGARDISKIIMQFQSFCLWLTAYLNSITS
jgi:hypothetical protein